MQSDCTSRVASRDNKFFVFSLSSSAPNSITSASSVDTGWNYLYALASRQNSKASSNIVTTMLKLFSSNVYYFIDLKSTLFYVTPFVAVHFSLGPECILDPFSVSTPVGESMDTRRVYKGCEVSVGGWETLVDLFKLDMVDFEVILGMDWLHSCLFFRLSNL